MAYAKKDGTEIISVVLKSTGYGEYTDTIKLFDYGFENFKTQNLCTQGSLCQNTTAIEEGLFKDETFNVTGNYASDVTVTLPLNCSLSDIETNVDLPKNIPVPLSKGDVIGSVSFALNGEEIGKTDIVSADDVGENAAAAMATAQTKKPIDIKLIAAALICLVVVLIILRFALVKLRYEHNRKKRRQRLKYYRDTNFKNLELSSKNRKYR